MNKQLKCTLQWILGIAAAAAAVVILLITAFEAAMYLDFSYYQKEYDKYNVLEDLDMEMEDVMYVTEEMMAYLRGEREELRVITTVDGVRQDFFNEQDRFHMEEVQGLFLGGMPASGKRGGRSGRMRFVFDFDESGFATDPFKELADHTRSAAGGGSGSRNRGSTGF